MLFTYLTLLAVIATATAVPLPLNCNVAPPSPNGTSGASGNITEAQILKIAPTSKTCATGGVAGDECRTAAQAAPLLNAAHKQFRITTKGEKAALVSLQAFESGEFKFNHNQAGNPGQGTRNEMNFPFIYQYALDTPATKAAALKLVPKGMDLSTVAASTQNLVLALMLPDNLSFASAAWFLKRSTATSGTKCDQSIIDGLKAETEAGWETYITGCVGTTVTPERKKVYDTALAALE